MKMLGQILLWIGFLSGALATVFNAPAKGVEYVKKEVTQEYANDHGFEFQDLSAIEVPEEGWNLIPWVWYAISASVSVVGIAMLYKSKSSEGQTSEESKSSISEIKQSFDRLTKKINLLSKDLDQLPPTQITKRIDDELADEFRLIAEGRDNITTEYGLDIFADVMTQFSAGERAVNRAWSASADGYIDEAATCLERGGLLVAEARGVLEKAEVTS